MIDGIKNEDWDFIFDANDTKYDTKLNNILDKYFAYTDDKISKIKNPLKSLKKGSQINALKIYVRRMGRDDKWLLEIPTIGTFRVAMPITEEEKKKVLKDQIVVFARMMESIRSTS